MEDIDSDFNLALNPVKAMLGLNSNYSSVLMWRLHRTLAGNGAPDIHEEFGNETYILTGLAREHELVEVRLDLTLRAGAWYFIRSLDRTGSARHALELRRVEEILPTATGKAFGELSRTDGSQRSDGSDNFAHFLW